MKRPKGFFAYPSNPSRISETISTAVEELNGGSEVVIKRWEDCKVNGKIIVDEICCEIAQADFFCADLTGVNPNVMFELGFAIMKNKKIWLIFDTSVKESRKEFNELNMLTTVGYAPYCNANDIVREFYKERIYQDLDNTLFANAIKPLLASDLREIVFYLKNRHNTESSRRASKYLQEFNIPQIIDDPTESASQPLAWYGVHVASSIGTVCHFTSPSREGERLHNAKCALVSGMAHGADKKLLMLAEHDYLVPIDYRDLLKLYQRPSQAVTHIKDWLLPIKNLFDMKLVEKQTHRTRAKLSVELRALWLGEHMAENEDQDLFDDYFVETAPYRKALEGGQLVFVGKKGMGKTSNFLKLASSLKNDNRNLVCVIKPVTYELQGIVKILKQYSDIGTKGYAVQTLWKYLLYCELALAAADKVAKKGAMYRPTEDEVVLLKIIERANISVSDDFSARLERCVDGLLKMKPNNSVVEAQEEISEIIHKGILKDLRVCLGRILSKANRVAILVDNLDKAWDKNSDTDYLAEVFLGLLTGANGTAHDFRRADSRNQSANISMAIFLRADIFEKIMAAAREKDKITHAWLRWDDQEMLMRVIDERLALAVDENQPPKDLWNKYFCTTVNGIGIREWLWRQILPRPRDLVFLMKAAVSIAVNRGHSYVQEEDFLEAKKQYSQHAFDTLLIEADLDFENLEEVLYEFVGANNILNYDEVAFLLVDVISENKIEKTIDYFCELGFLGLETDYGVYKYSNDLHEYRKNSILAKKLSEMCKVPIRYIIHPAFHSALEIKVNKGDSPQRGDRLTDSKLKVPLPKL